MFGLSVWVREFSFVEGGGCVVKLGGGGKALETNRPVSNAGDAIGPSSVVIWKIPSKGRSENGFATSAETLASTLEAQAHCQYRNSAQFHTSLRSSKPTSSCLTGHQQVHSLPRTKAQALGKTQSHGHLYAAFV